MDKNKYLYNRSILSLLIAFVILVTSFVPMTVATASDLPAANLQTTRAVIYDNALASGWQDWSWDTTRSFTNTTPVASSPRSIAVTYTKAWAAFYLHHNGLSTAGFTNLEFSIHGGSKGGQIIKVIVNGNTGNAYSLTAPANKWNTVSVPLKNLGSPAQIVDLWFQDASGKVQAKYYLDNLALTGSGVAPTATRPAPSATPTRATTQPAPSATPTRVPSQPAPSATPTVYLPTVTATAPTSNTVFKTLPPGSALPSDAQCAALVKKRPENKRMNASANATRGSQTLASNFFDPYANDPRANTQIASRVTGNFTGTTDEILQWAACKWGIDEDMVRAQAAIESWWQQPTLGDWTTNAANCAPGYGLGANGKPGQCPESFGILQNRYPYEKSAWPGIANSTAFNADTAYAIWRTCYEGYEHWLNDVDRGKDYAAGDAWGCMGRWFAGRWYTAAANDYTSRVQGYYNQRIWETANFQEP